jgi:tetratricopeptide (TPR) repeat protein
MRRFSRGLFKTCLLVSIVCFSLPPSAHAQASNASKARALVDAAIKMTDSNAAVKLLWQATDIDPTLDDAYVYLGLYYNSRSDFPNVIKVYQKLVKNEPNQVSAYLNIGEAFMSWSSVVPASERQSKVQQALAYYRKAYEMDPKNSFAALRIGQVLAESGSRDEAMKYLKIALAARGNASASSEAEKALRQMGAL